MLRRIFLSRTWCVLVAVLAPRVARAAPILPINDVLLEDKGILEGEGEGVYCVCDGDTCSSDMSCGNDLSGTCGVRDTCVNDGSGDCTNDYCEFDHYTENPCPPEGTTVCAEDFCTSDACRSDFSATCEFDACVADNSGQGIRDDCVADSSNACTDDFCLSDKSGECTTDECVSDKSGGAGTTCA